MPDLKAIPHFKTEDEERDFWATHDSADYVDWDKGVTATDDSIPELRPSIDEGRHDRSGI